MSCPLTLISSSCWSGAFLVLLSVECAAGSCFLCLPCYLPPSLPLFSPLWLLFHCCHSLSYVAEDEHLDVAIIGKFFVHSSASVCAVPLKQHAVQAGSTLGKLALHTRHSWQMLCEMEAETSTLLVCCYFMSSHKLARKGTWGSYLSAFCARGRIKYISALFRWCLLNLFLKSCIAASSQLPRQLFSILSCIWPLHLIQNT